MRKLIRTILFLTLIFNSLPFFSVAQQNKIDSLQKLIRTIPAKNDTNRLEPFNQLCRSYNNIGAYDSTIAYGKQLLAMSIAIELPTDTSSKIWRAAKRGTSNAYQALGFANYFKTNYTEALTNWNNGVKINEELNDKTRLAKNLGNVGVVYKELGDLPKALSYYLKDLKIAEEIKNKKIQSQALGNIGVIYWNQGERAKALTYYYKALDIKEELGDKIEIANTTGNIGIVYMELANVKNINQSARDSLNYLAILYCQKALKINQELENKSGACSVLGNIGNIYLQQSDFEKAKEYFLNAWKLAVEIGDKSREAIWLTNLGRLYTLAPKLSPPSSETSSGFQLAEKYLLRSLSISALTGAAYEHQQGEVNISFLYEKMNKNDLALAHYKKAMDEKDSIFTKEKDQELTRRGLTYEFEKKENETRAAQEKKDAIVQAESAKQKLLITLAIIGLVIVLAFALYILRSLNITRKQKIIIEEKSKETEQQKSIIEEKNKDILDSIQYAKRIQNSLLPTEKYINKSFKRLRK